jgi:ADP-ribose pyrophosphatase YjhB (NUDIX family)
MNAPRIRVGAICRDNNSLLLVEHEKEGKRYWLLPGGGLQAGETMEEALRREVAEETSIGVRVGILVCVCESISPDANRHIVHFLYETTRANGTPGPSEDPRVRSSAFIPIKNLSAIILYPPIQHWLQRRLAEGFIGTPEYLASMWA